MIKKRSLVSKSSNSLNAMIKWSSVAINNSHLKKITFIATAILILSVTAAFSFDDINFVLAAKNKPGKSVDVQNISNGYPSGPHFNLNIHGRDIPWNGCEKDFTIPYELGKNINVPLRTAELDHIPQIEFVTNNKRSDVTTLTVLDNCTQHVHPSDHDPARILLPKNPAEDEFPGGYYVYARILAKPNNGNFGLEPSNVVFTPNLNLLTVCNQGEVVLEDFETFTGCDDLLLALGVVTADSQVFDSTGQELERFDETQVNKQGKQTGKSKAVDVTGMFYWKGAVCPDELDADGNDDGVLQLSDLDFDNDGDVQADDLQALIDAGTFTSTAFPIGADLFDAVDLVGNGGNGNGEIDAGDEFLALLALIDGCTVFDDWVWIFDIADIVIHGFDYENDGSKLVQLRFYDANSANVQYGGNAPIP